MSNIEPVINLSNAILQSLQLPEYGVRGLCVDMLRLDKIHPVISGNKWFKLKNYLQDAIENHHNTVITFGGAWSNHIIATACMASICSLRSIGLIRGERPLIFSQTLLDAGHYGMTLEFMSRESYAKRNDEHCKKELEERFGKAYLIPEGGAGLLGIKGSKDILDLIEVNDYSHIVCCIGTGTMFSGLVSASLKQQELIGISVLKGITYIPTQITEDPQRTNNWKVINDYHFGGYAKKNAELIQFMNNFYRQTGVPTDFVYTGKLIFAFSDLVFKKYFPENSKILIIHSGGLQGNASLPPGTLLF